MEKVLLECYGDGRFTAGREAGQPNCKARLFAELGAFSTGERGVPCYVPDEKWWLIE